MTNLTPAMMSNSVSGTNTPVTATIGESGSNGTTILHNIVITLSGGSAAVPVTISGLNANHSFNTTVGEMGFLAIPGVSLNVRFPDDTEEMVEGGPQITATGIPGSGQTLAITLVGKYN